MIDTLLDTHPDQCCPVEVNKGLYWCHELNEGEWFYLVGGYEVFTGGFFFFWSVLCLPPAGKGDQREDRSWWPKVTTWEGSPLDVGCWTPMCEQWFQKCLVQLREGSTRPYNASQWAKNLRYAKLTKKFFETSKKIGRNFLAGDGGILKG
jgi:hypothetical protein